ncbi:hypothetical protein PUNSTDRAFT_121726 [Punctularia strigosozonata HHB-11173 SS5]|uniref:uncharacterized protein n=1 Tax=Punctularia strigosozonata (strain HHB-11173) TaxID=741275 RepID=UPI0004416B8F|nr:uncharacterized protein PUNSTDRAFT_121726 [Punctularia strigosozonata HHB-11173 SS5]EIN06549.1 hypothetical protein PUNSTDRAFT_121726 [Punctularia strigosozonata HHB-11173 SS5]
MSRPTLLPMSQLIVNDAPLLSPVSSPVDVQHPPIFDSFSFQYTNIASMPTALKTHLRGSPGADGSDSEQATLCLPTHQVFDFELNSPPEAHDDVDASTTRGSPAPSAVGDLPTPVAGGKRAASNGPGGSGSAPKKPRGPEGRVTTKEFIPPDVSGLSKREARLVKNRAAAFLSRQRKREEFEQMEIRVAELEQENARLRSGSPQDEDLLSEVEQLRARLAAAEQRERELNEKLTRTEQTVKMEHLEPEMHSQTMMSRSPSPALQNPTHRSAASLGLMVLLCALPTLLSVHPHSHDGGSSLPARFSFPLSSVAASRADAFSAFVPADVDLDFGSFHSSSMDIDSSVFARPSSPIKKLEFADMEGVSEALGLGGLDISFDASPVEDGRIRVRIHNPSSASAASASAAASSMPSNAVKAEPFAPSMSWSSDTLHNGDADPLGPFLGVPASHGDDFEMSIGSPFEQHFAFDSGSDSGANDFDGMGMGLGMGAAGLGAAGSASSKSKRRVRIALKSMPKPGGEGGEWEVQVC